MTTDSYSPWPTHYTEFVTPELISTYELISHPYTLTKINAHYTNFINFDSNVNASLKSVECVEKG
jgi:hypothetical protein